MAPAKRLFLSCLALWGGVAVLYLGGALEVVEVALIDTRFKLVTRTAHPNLVLVKIDSISLDEVGVWPWPRSLHAIVLERLLAAGATKVAFDIDFSSRSGEEEDARLEEALRHARGRVILPVFLQFRDHAGGAPEIDATEPLPRFRDHVVTASVNIRPDRDGMVRRMSLAASWEGRPVPTLAGILAASRAVAPDPYYIDYGIRFETIPQISYIDVLKGTFDPRTVAGRQVLVGATAIELGDMHTVPVWQALPGIAVQALAVQSIIQGRTLQRLPHFVILAGILALRVREEITALFHVMRV